MYLNIVKEILISLVHSVQQTMDKSMFFTIVITLVIQMKELQGIIQTEYKAGALHAEVTAVPPVTEFYAET